MRLQHLLVLTLRHRPALLERTAMSIVSNFTHNSKAIDEDR